MKKILTAVAIVGIVAATASKKNCATFDGEKTPTCPNGEYVVTVDESVTPPKVDRVCKDPADPGEPSPTPPPSSPTPPPSNPPPPTTTTTTTSTTTTTTTTIPPPPPPSPTPPPLRRIPADPVPLRHEGACRDIGMVRLWTPPNEGSVPLCVAPSVCETHVCNEGDYGLTAAIMADTHCKSFVRELDTSIRFFVITPEGFGCDKSLGRGCFDAYGRVYARGNGVPNRGLEQRQPPPAGSWTYRGWCPPLAVMQSGPRPSPTPVPSPTPTPAPTPTPPPGDGVCSHCPPPTSMKVGINKDARKLAQGYRNIGGGTVFTRGDCLHKNITDCVTECAASEGCADHIGSPYQSRYGQPQAYQTGNGFTKHPVERQTDSCNRNDSSQLACGYNLTFATNHPDDWSGGRFKYAGAMEVGVSMPNLDYWYYREGHMGADGKMFGFDGLIRTREKTADEKRGIGIPGYVPAQPDTVPRGAKALRRHRSVYSGFPDLK